jgi:hypothetical protein
MPDSGSNGHHGVVCPVAYWPVPARLQYALTVHSVVAVLLLGRKEYAWR